MTLTDARTIHVSHSPDADDAFMFWPLAAGRVPTGPRRYVHELADIETLNRRALRGELEVTAVSLHAYAYLADRYALLAHGASVGDRYGPRLVARVPAPADPRAALAGLRVAVPGELTTAFLTLRLYQPLAQHVVVPFDQIEAMHIRRLLARSKSIEEAAEAPDRGLVGMAVGAVVDGRAWVFGMWVEPGWRGRGTGGALLDSVITWLHQQRPAEPIFLDVNPRQTAAVRLYESRGFRATGKSKNLDHSPGEIAVEMCATPTDSAT
jgi:ribosomal protein S18 acetylase RimI-like enzyme